MSIKVVDYRAANAAQQFAAGLRDIGFAVIANHPVNQELIEKNYEVWGDFFRSPESEKLKFEFDTKKHDCFASVALSETAKGYDKKDLKEFYHFYTWGRCPEHLRPVTLQLYSELNIFAETLLQWIEQNAPQDIQDNLSIPLSDMIKGSKRTLFRMIHYPPLRGNEPLGAVRAAPHGDINLLTVLPAATAEGLQVKDSQGRWIEVPINPNWIIVNIGDMLQECTQGYYPSTQHRVMNPTGEAAKKSRLSMPLFLHPLDDVQLSSRYTAESYRLERYKELGLL